MQKTKSSSSKLRYTTSGVPVVVRVKRDKAVRELGVTYWGGQEFETTNERAKQLKHSVDVIETAPPTEEIMGGEPALNRMIDSGLNRAIG